MESVIRSFSERSRPFRNSDLASADAVVTGILPASGGVVPVSAAGAGTSFFAQAIPATLAATAIVQRRASVRSRRMVPPLAFPYDESKGELGSPAHPSISRFRPSRGPLRDLGYFAAAFFSPAILMSNFPRLSMKKTHSDPVSQAVVCFWFAGWNRYEPGPSLTSGFPSSP